MIALDTSLVIAAFATWHEHHETALSATARSPALAAHTALESYSVLTRLPEPFRAEADLAARYLTATFPTKRLALDADEQAQLPARLARMEVAGGAVYDALIALTARAAGAELFTLDRRAMPIYERCGVEATLVA